MKILYTFASRSRPDKFVKCVDNIYANSRTTDWTINAAIDTDDVSMNNEKMVAKLNAYDKVTVLWGKSLNKIDAINRSMTVVPEFDILVNMSDDMMFTKKGFDEIIVSDMTENFPDTDGVLHYDDGNQKSNVMTMTIYGREYYKRFNYIYHPAYESLFCDNEQTLVAKALKKYKYMGDGFCIFKHLHPAWGLAPMDDQYYKTEDRKLWAKDEQTFLTRQRNNFDLPYIAST